MKNKILVLSLLTSVFAVGCAEGGFAPNNGTPLNNTGFVPQNPMFPNNMNPGFQNTQNMPFQNNQQMMFPQHQQQNMLSFNMRMRMPGFYYTNYQTRGCIPRRSYVTSTEQRVARKPCPYVITTVDRTNNTNTSVTTDTSTDVVTTPAADKTVVYAISWVGEDAKAIYERLAKEERVLEKDRLLNKGVKARTGKNINCVVDGKESQAKNYVCDLDVRAKDGLLMEQELIGKDGTPDVADSLAYKGDLLNIGNPGESPEVGYLVIAGIRARQLYSALSVEVVNGTVAEASNVEASIKTMGQVKCYQTTKTTRAVTECIVKIETNTGTALNF